MPVLDRGRKQRRPTPYAKLPADSRTARHCRPISAGQSPACVGGTSLRRSGVLARSACLDRPWRTVSAISATAIPVSGTAGRPGTQPLEGSSWVAASSSARRATAGGIRSSIANGRKRSTPTNRVARLSTLVRVGQLALPTQGQAACATLRAVIVTDCLPAAPGMRVPLYSGGHRCGHPYGLLALPWFAKTRIVLESPAARMSRAAVAPVNCIGTAR